MAKNISVESTLPVLSSTTSSWQVLSLVEGGEVRGGVEAAPFAISNEINGRSTLGLGAPFAVCK